MKTKTKLIISKLCDIIYLTLFALSISVFWIGFHNEDLGHNMRYLEALYDIELCDNAIGYNGCISGIDAMKIGRIQQTISLFFLYVSSLYIGVMLSGKVKK